MPDEEEPRPHAPASLAPSSEPFYPSIPAAPISSTDYSHAPAVSSGVFGDHGEHNPYSGMGYDLLPGDEQTASPPAPADASLLVPGFSEGTGFSPYPGEPPSVEDLYRAPGNPYADHSGRAIPSAPASPPARGVTTPGGSPYSAPGAAPQPGHAPTPASPIPGPPTRKRGAGCLAGVIAVIAIGALVIQGLVSIVSTFTTESSAPGPTATPPATVALPTVADTALEEGMCFEELEYVSGNRLQPVSCEEPHRFEVSRNVAVPGTQYPGEDEMAELASTRCRDAASDLTEEFDTRPLTPNSFYPSEGTWQNGDETITCFISVAGSQRLYGSARDGDLEVR